MVDDKAHSREESKGRRQMRAALLPVGPQDEDVIQVEDEMNTPRVEKGLQQMQMHAKAEWKNHVLIKKASPTEAAIDGDVKEGVLEIDRTLPNRRGEEGPPRRGLCPSGSGERREMFF